MLSYSKVKTGWGCFGFVTRDNRLLATYLPHKGTNIDERVGLDWPKARIERNLLPELTEAVQGYFEGEVVDFDVELDLSSRTPFQQRVMLACKTIPYGETLTYGQLAEMADSKRAARAVGQTMASNTLPLVVPCHRVLSSTGLGGFTSPGGVEYKGNLLAMEQNSR